MEDAPKNLESEAEFTDKKAVKKKARQLGSFAVETQPNKTSGERKKKSPERQTSKNDALGTKEQFIGRKLAQAYSLEAPQKVTTDPVRGRTSHSNIETLERAELLLVSEKIIVDGTDLRKIYETRLIGEWGLRRLVIEHLRGGNMKKALRYEILERETDFELDPAMRDKAKAYLNNQESGSPNLQALLQKAGVVLPNENEQTAPTKLRPNEMAKKQDTQARRRVLDISLTSIILILLAIIILLLISRH